LTVINIQYDYSRSSAIIKNPLHHPIKFSIVSNGVLARMLIRGCFLY
jgi:hypothetical protein